MLAEAMTRFRDLEANAYREAGERFEVSRERFDAINGTRYGQLVAEVPTKDNVPTKDKVPIEAQTPAEKETPAEHTRRRRTRKEG